MKAIENKFTGILNEPFVEGKEPVYAKYSDMIITIVNTTFPTNNAGQSVGLTPAEMRKRIRILKAIEKSEKDPDNLIVLEDHDADKLQEIMKMSKFPYMHQSILDLEDDIIGMKYESEARKIIAEKSKPSEENYPTVELQPLETLDAKSPDESNPFV